VLAVNESIRQTTAPPAATEVPAEIRAFLRSVHAAKLGAARMYMALAEQMRSVEGRLAVERLAAEEGEYAAALARIAGTVAAAEVGPAVAPGCGLHDESWPSALMMAFALDQAATAALLPLSRADDVTIAGTANRIGDDERAHQFFAIGAFKQVAAKDPAAGRHLAAEMLVARDWVKQVFPRHAILAQLAADGTLPADAAKVHDSFLASLGDRIQEALGVLGD